jgi:uncharacterized lipoprotein YddW (UPF0748 family)
MRVPAALVVGLTTALTAAAQDTAVLEVKGRGVEGNIFVPSSFMARSEPMPLAGAEEGSFDPLGHLIAMAHAAGLEVHPWLPLYYHPFEDRGG